MPRTLASLRSAFRAASREKAKDEESEIDGAETGEPGVQDTVVEPLDGYQCSSNCRHITDGEVLFQ